MGTAGNEQPRHPSRPGPKRIPGVSDRYAVVRIHYGSKGEDTTPRAFALELGVHPQTYRQWELGSFPGVQRLAEAYSAHPRVRELGTPPEKLARWVKDGVGAMPWGPTGDRRLTHSDTAPTTPAEPLTLSRAEQLLEDTVRMALAALPPGAEEAKRILDGGLRVVHDARRLGLATIFVAIAAVLAASSRADAIDSGSSERKLVQVQVLSSAIELLREARRRLKRAARCAVAFPQPPSPPSPSLSAAAVYGSIISLDDVRALVLEPTHLARAKKTG